MGALWSTFRHGLAELVRGVSACVFPFFALLAWVGILAAGQGEDVVRRSVERAALDDSGSDLVALAISSVLLGLSIWYAMRSLLSVQRPGLPPPDPGPNGPTAWLPRLFAAVAVAWPGWVAHEAVAWTATSPDAAARAIARTGLLAAAVLGALALALLVLLWRRAPLLRLARVGGPAPILAGDALPAPVVRAIFWALALMALCAALVLTLPLSVTRVVGSASLVALALACINVFGSFVLTLWPLRRGLPGLAWWTVALAVLASPWNDNHAPVAHSLAHRGPAQRPAIDVAYARWLAERGTADPVYVVATEGGGIRAAYWTAAVLERLAADPQRHFARDLFAISSVSGGSVGAGFWVAGERARRCEPSAELVRPDVATRALTTDFLSPAVGFMLFPDLMQRFVPHPFPQANRSRGLEESWQRALGTLPGRPMDRSLAELYDGCPALPQLLVNATVAETGQRAVLTRLATDGFVDVFALPAGSAVDPSTDHQPLAGVLLQSARFPVVSPAGSVVDLHDPGHRRITRLIDGGYFDNSGIVTALELIDGMRVVADSPPIVLIVISDATYDDCTREADTPYCRSPTVPPARTAVRGPVAGTAWLNEPLPILTGLFDVRDSHVLEAMARALRTTQVAVLDRSLAVRGETRAQRAADVAAPLGWALSRSVTDMLDKQSAWVAGRMPLQRPDWRPPARLAPHGADHG
jgi:hypothetical protein